MKNKAIKKIMALALSGVMMMSLVGCGGSAPTGGDTAAPAGDAATGDVAADAGSEASSAAPTVAPGKKGTIEFWTVFTGADGSSMQAMVDAYNATGPDYTVNHRAIEANDLYLKMPLAIQSGQDVPDVAINHVERIPVFQENGFLTDYTSLLPNSKIKKENYLDTAWSMTSLAGGQYGIPLDVHSFVTYVNMDLYEKYGNGALDDDVLTWDEIMASGEAAKADGIIATAIGWQRANFLGSYAQLGGTLSSDGSAPSFNNPQAIQVFDQWSKMQEAGYMIKEGDSPWEMFLGGQILYMPEGIWMLNQAKESEMNYKMVEYPAFSTEQRGGWTSSHQFVLPKNDNRPEDKTAAVLDFIDWIGNNGLEWAKAGQRPAHLSINEVAEFKDMPQSFITDDYLRMYDYKYYGYAVESLDKIFVEVLYGRMPAADGLSKAEQETKDRIATEG